MGDHNRQQASHVILKATVWMPDENGTIKPITFNAPHIRVMGLIPGTMVPFIDVSVEEDNIRRLTGFSHSDTLMGPPPSIQVANVIPKLI